MTQITGFSDFLSKIFFSLSQARKEKRKTTCVAVLGVQKGVKDPCPNCPNEYCICNPHYKSSPRDRAVVRV